MCGNEADAGDPGDGFSDPSLTPGFQMPFHPTASAFAIKAAGSPTPVLRHSGRAPLHWEHAHKEIGTGIAINAYGHQPHCQGPTDDCSIARKRACVSR